MAGNYPDLPAPRIEYDRDGTRVYRISANNSVSELSPAEVSAINDENRASQIDYGNEWGNFRFFWVFPELRDVSHALIDMIRDNNSSGGATQRVEWSADSTNGLDGTWTTSVEDFSETFDTPTRWRDDIRILPGITGAKMLRIVATNAYFNRLPSVHLYGKATAGQNLHRLRLWHPTLDAPLDDHPAHLDWGNVPQDSTATKQFRVKNDSPNLGASGVKVFMQAISDSNPSQVSQHQLSLDGSTFSGAASPGVTIESLSAQEISEVVYLRRNTLLSAQLGLWRQRLVAAADTWS